MDFPIIDLKLTGRRIKELCKQADLSALQIKRHLNLCCVQTVYKWFSGRNVPTIENFYALSLMLGVSMEDLLVTRNQPDHSIFWQKNTQ
ncbi:MAG: helix-turn-helix transcriptional regulator, partial [Lachnospiraceae bacterium]|nr:helix-turn-helix transcriptional regulator [Lachnospiraceae bacterium]